MSSARQHCPSHRRHLSARGGKERSGMQELCTPWLHQAMLLASDRQSCMRHAGSDQVSTPHSN